MKYIPFLKAEIIYNTNLIPIISVSRCLWGYKSLSEYDILSGSVFTFFVRNNMKGKSIKSYLTHRRGKTGLDNQSFHFRNTNISRCVMSQAEIL